MSDSSLRRRTADRRDEPSLEPPETAPPQPGPEALALLDLQRGAGNAAVARMLAARAPARPTLARDYEVDLEGWGDPLIGHDDSDVTFMPLATFEPDPGMEEPTARWYEKASGLPDDGGRTGKVKMRAGTKGKLTLKMKAHFFLDQKWNDEVNQTFSCTWDVSADKFGKLTIGSASKLIKPPDTNEPEFSLEGIDTKEDQSSGYVEMTPQFVSYQNTDIPNISIGGEVGVGKQGGGGSVGGNVTLGNERTYPGGKLAVAFRVNIVVTDIAPPPEPEVIIESVSMRRHLTWDVKFGVDKPVPTGDEENKLVAWYTGLNAETQRLIREENEKVKLEGFASTTGKGTYNRELAEKRVAAVKRILRSLGVKEFDDVALGEYVPGMGEMEGSKEDPEKRKVTVEVVEAPVTVTPGSPSSGP
jgi:outer membrane protein OmpA-like peptidoglycan-associated protein